MPGTQFGLESNGERRFLYAFVKLKQVRMAGADSNPDYFHRSFWWKCSNALDRQKKSAKFDRAQFFTERELDLLKNIREKAESQMHLVAYSPADTANARIEIDQNVANGFRRID